MSEYRDVAAVSEIPEGSVRCFEINGRRIAIARTARGIFAVDDSCPHRGGPLSEGSIHGCEIVCPWHFWTFDLATGRHTGGSKFAVPSHEIRIENGRILIRLSPPIALPWMVP